MLDNLPKLGDNGWLPKRTRTMVEQNGESTHRADFRAGSSYFSYAQTSDDGARVGYRTGKPKGYLEAGHLFRAKGATSNPESFAKENQRGKRCKRQACGWQKQTSHVVFQVCGKGPSVRVPCEQIMFVCTIIVRWVYRFIQLEWCCAFT